MAKINVQNTEITVVSHNDDDYISLTDMARSQLQEHIIFRWLSLKSTIEYLGEWEMLYNPNFNCTEFGTFRNMAGSNNFVLSVKTWIAVLINEGVPQGERLVKLNQIAIQQMQVLEGNSSRNLLK